MPEKQLSQPDAEESRPDLPPFAPPEEEIQSTRVISISKMVLEVAPSRLESPGVLPRRMFAQLLSIPGYDILEELGRGGMGVVYKALQHSLNRHVAIKIIRKERLTDPETVRRFRREAEVAARLLHPNIAVIHDAGCAGDTYFLAMEYVEGLNLQRLVQETGTVPFELACDYVRQAALGLQHAFERGLVHRDIKPANLIVAARVGSLAGALTPPPQGGAGGSGPGMGVLKILDMGLARLYESGSGSDAANTITWDGALMGTPDYISPEQANNPHGADVRADLYSLGCTFYFLLTGQVPFPGGTVLEKLDRHRWEEPAPVARFQPDIPGGIVTILRKLLAKRPDQRFQTPAELALALDLFTGTNSFPDGYRPARPVPTEASEPPSTNISAITRGDVTRGTTPHLEGHRGWVRGVAFSPDGRQVLSGSGDCTMRLWDLQTALEVRRFAGGKQFFAGVAFSPDGHLAVSANHRFLRLWNLEEGHEVQRFGGHDDDVSAVAFSPDGRLLISGSKDQTVRLWDVETGEELIRLGGHVFGRHWDVVLSVAFSPDCRNALSGSKDHTLRLWNVETGKELSRFEGHAGAVYGVAFSPDGRRIVSGSGDKTVRLWDVESGQEVRRLTGHEQPVRSVAFVPDGRRALTGSHDMTVRLWDLATGQELSQFREHPEKVLCVAVSPDGRICASGGADNKVRLWTLPNGGPAA